MILEISPLTCGGKTPLMNAIINKQTDTAKSLIVDTHDTNINTPDDMGNTALMFAAINGDVGMINLLIANGVDVNMRNNLGHTALMFAASGGLIRRVC